MIPKIIHYCWFGGKEKPDLAKKCIESWKKFCPDYEIIEWNEQNFDLDTIPYTRWCYDNKKWAFLSDYVRLHVVYEQGGIYFDTDVETLRSFDPLLAFDAFYGWETDVSVATGLGFGAIAQHPTVKAMIEQYAKLLPDSNGEVPLIACPKLNTAALLPFGLVLDGKQQNVAGAEILPVDFINPYEYTTGRMRKSENTYSIHWYNQSWISPMGKLRSKLTKPFHRIFGIDCFQWLKRE